MREAAGEQRPGDELAVAMDSLLAKGMGIRPLWGPGMFGFGPGGSAIGWLVVYGSAWALAEGVAWAVGIPPEPRLVLLLAWGGGYAAVVTVFAMVATRLARETVVNDVVEHSSPRYRAAVAEDLGRRHHHGRLTKWSVPVGVAALFAALWAIDRDIGLVGRIPLYAPELVLWAASYLYYFICAARAVLAARFYLSFAVQLPEEHDRFYLFAVAETPLVRALSRLGTVMLGFWALVFVLVLSYLLLAQPGFGRHAFPSGSIFILLLVPLAGIFSMGMGSAAYVESEFRIRTTLRRFVARQTAALQAEANAALDSAGGRLAADPDKLQLIADWHDRIVAGGRYGSGIRAALSVAVPLAGLIQTAYGWLHR